MIIKVKENIKSELKIRKLSAKEICRRLGKDRRYIYLMTDSVKACKLVDIANTIGCSASELFKGV